MRHPQLIGPSPRSTPGRRASRRDERPLPRDLLQEASRRLAIMALLGATLWILATLLYHLALRGITHGDPSWRRFGTTEWIALASAAISLALFFYTRTSKRDPQFILDLALAYMILTSMAIGISFHWGAPPRWNLYPMLTWLGALIVIFPAIVPTPPLKTLVASLIAVSMNPISMLIARAEGFDFGPLGNVALMHIPDYLLVPVAVVISHVVTGLGQQVTKARELGSYELGELLGRGGMGEVYKATHRMLARPAAIKVIRSEVLSSGNGGAAQLAIRRFRREAEAAASLRSPHTVELYDFGMSEDETLYFVMELLDGMTLDLLVRRHGPLPASRVIYILRQVCESLEEAHRRGLVHRDIKPANIHVGRLGLHHDFVKVLDFGLVKAIAGTKAGETLATAAGFMPGTPAYMAPEIALGEAVDGRADIYALGCVAYFLLSGKLVFEADTSIQIVAKHMREAPALPSTRGAPAVPPALERLVLACLAKRPEDRPQSAADLARALAAIDLEPWSEEQARRWWSTESPAAPSVN